MLSFGTLRRYEYFFRMDKEKGKPFLDSREQLLEAVEEHFANTLKVNPVDVIYKFLSTKKDQEAGTEGYMLRPPDRTRNPRNPRKDYNP